jgi:prophage regulatory protein
MPAASNPTRKARLQAAPQKLSFSRLPAVMARTGLARPTIYAKMATDEFPRQISLGRAVAWLDHEVDAWIAARIQHSRNEDYSPADKLPIALRERHSGRTAPEKGAAAVSRA